VILFFFLSFFKQPLCTNVKKIIRKRNKKGGKNHKSDPSLLHSPWYIYILLSIIVQRQQNQVGCVGCYIVSWWLVCFILFFLIQIILLMRRCWVDSNFFVVYFFCLSSFVSSVNCVGVNVKGWFFFRTSRSEKVFTHKMWERERETSTKRVHLCVQHSRIYCSPKQQQHGG
jgi:hypothetical protein